MFVDKNEYVEVVKQKMENNIFELCVGKLQMVTLTNCNTGTVLGHKQQFLNKIKKWKTYQNKIHLFTKAFKIYYHIEGKYLHKVTDYEYITWSGTFQIVAFSY